LLDALKRAVGVEFMVTRTEVTGEVQAGTPGFTTLKVTVFTPTLFQLKVKGPCVVEGGVLQLSQFQLKVAPVFAVPDQVNTPLKFVVEGVAHIGFVLVPKGLLGVELTVTTWVKIGAVQAGFPEFVTTKLIVLAPVVFQLIVWGPCPTGFPPLQPSQFQEKIGLGKAVPCHDMAVVALVVEGDAQIV
jgi:hypothetical protein